MNGARRMVVAGLALVALLLGLGQVAQAAARRVLVIPLTGSVPGDKGDALARLTQVVARSAGLTGAEVTIARTSFDDTAALAGCAEPDPECLGQIARYFRVDEVVLGTVTPARDRKSVTVSLTAFVRGGVTQETFTLPGRDVDAMVEALAQQVPALFVGSSADEPPAAPAEPAPAPPAAVPIEAPPAPAREGGFHARRVGTLAWIVAGTGTVALGTGVAFLLVARERQDEVDAAPIASVEDFERLHDLEESGQRLTGVGNGLLVGGGVALLAGAALVLYQGYSSERDAPARLSLLPTVSPSGAGLSFTVTLP